MLNSIVFLLCFFLLHHPLTMLKSQLLKPPEQTPFFPCSTPTFNYYELQTIFFVWWIMMTVFCILPISTWTLCFFNRKMPLNRCSMPSFQFPMGKKQENVNKNTDNLTYLNTHQHFWIIISSIYTFLIAVNYCYKHHASKYSIDWQLVIGTRKNTLWTWNSDNTSYCLV